MDPHGVINDLIHLTVERFEEIQKQYPNAQFEGDLTPLIQHEKLFKTPEEIRFD